MCTVTPSFSTWRTSVDARGVVELDRHQPRRHLDDVGVQPQLDERVRRLEAEQPAADDDAAGRRSRSRPGSPRGPRSCGRRSSRPAAALDRRDEGRRARREDEHVVVVDRDRTRVHPLVEEGALAPVTRPRRRRRHDRDRPRLAVDLGHDAVEDEPHPRVVVLPTGQERERLGARVAEPAREADAVVRRPRLLAEDHDVVGLGQPALDGGLGEPVAHHAVPDDDDPLALGHAEDGRKRDVVGGFRECFGRENWVARPHAPHPARPSSSRMPTSTWSWAGVT